MYVCRSQRSKTHPAYLLARVTGWNDVGLDDEAQDPTIDRPIDEIILINTFRNSQHLVETIPRVPLTFEDHRPRRIRWFDGSDGRRNGHVSDHLFAV